MNEQDDYDVFLETWKPSGLLCHSSLPQYQNDPLSRKYLTDDSSGKASVKRAPYRHGRKVMNQGELTARKYSFFQGKQKIWSAEFKDYVLDKSVPKDKFERFIQAFANLWIDGKSRRQDSPQMQQVKASIRVHDQTYHSRYVDRFVINKLNDGLQPLFTSNEMKTIFEANENLVDAFLPQYLDFLGNEGPDALDELYVRRGVFILSIPTVLQERNYLSSYSFALGPVEQFSQLWTSETKNRGTPCIFSAPISAIQHRIVAFSPFIEGMDLSQLELVVAPPVEELVLLNDGVHGGIHELSFK
jgi:hypothetical protein